MAYRCECEVCGAALSPSSRVFIDPVTFDAYCGPDCAAAASEMTDEYAERLLARELEYAAPELLDGMSDDEALELLTPCLPRVGGLARFLR